MRIFLGRLMMPWVLLAGASAWAAPPESPKPLPYAAEAAKIEPSSGCKRFSEAFRTGAEQALGGRHYLFTGFATQDLSLSAGKPLLSRGKLLGVGTSALDPEMRACLAFRKPPSSPSSEAESSRLECCLQGYYAGTNRLAERVMSDSKKPVAEIPEEINECFRSFQKGILGSESFCLHAQSKREPSPPGLDSLQSIEQEPRSSGCPSLNLVGVDYLGCHFLGFLSGFSTCPCDALQGAKEKLSRHAPSVNTLIERKDFILPNFTADKDEAQPASERAR